MSMWTTLIQQATESASELVKEVVKDATAAVVNETLAGNGTDAGKKPKSTPEGMVVAYTSLVIMALLPIIIGARKSVKHQAHQKKTSEVS